MKHPHLALLLAMVVLAPASALAEGRTTVPLDGTWEIEDGKLPDEIPAEFKHTVPVPGLANLAYPGLRTSTSSSAARTW